MKLLYKKSRFNDSSGFATYSMVLVAPLFLILSFFVCWLTWFLIQKQRVDNLCHHHVLKAQEILVQHNNKVLAMNGYATYLITQKRILMGLMLSPIPAVSQAAQVAYHATRMQQKALNITQQTLIQSGNLRSRMKAFSLRKDFSKTVRSMEKFWQSPPTHPRIEIYWKNSQIQKQFREIAPPYKRASNHQRKQRIYVRWEIPLSALMPQWLKKLVPIHEQWKGQCASQPIKRRTQWIPTITKDRALLRL